MIDAHVHIEKDPYTIEYIMKYVDTALKRGIDEINLLEHTHRFTEWKPLYDLAVASHPKMAKWLNDKKTISIHEYYDLINQVRQLDLPVKINFGLEVCYFYEREDFIRKMINDFDYDFMIGSIHYIHNIAYDLDDISPEILWNVYEHNELYRSYYEDTKRLIKSDLFTQLAHMDTIKKYNIYPTYDLKPTYYEIADLLNEHHMQTECNVGCFYRYGHADLGLSDELLNILKEKQVKIVTCSDAHKPDDVGIYLKEANQRICK